MSVHRADPAPSPPEREVELATDSAYLLNHLEEEAADRRTLRWALAAAVLFHALLFLVNLPDRDEPIHVAAAGKPKSYVVRQVRFRPPPKAAPQQTLPEKKRKKIPVPDPTPDDPEPIRSDEAFEVEFDEEATEGDVFFRVPEGPPGPGLSGDPLQVGGEVSAPIKLHAPRPHYTEEARRARIQGAVLVQAIIDREGNVRDVKLLKGLGAGLDESAMETVLGWKFKPAMRGGEPVPVYYNLTVMFSIQ